MCVRSCVCVCVCVGGGDDLYLTLIIIVHARLSRHFNLFVLMHPEETFEYIFRWTAS